MSGHFSAHPWCHSKMILFVFFCLFWGTKRSGQRRPHPSPAFGPKLLTLHYLSHAVLQWGFNSCNLCSLQCSNLYCVCPWWSRASLHNRKDAKVFLCICSHLPAQKPHTDYSIVSWRSLVLITCRPSTILILKPFFSFGTQPLIWPTRRSLLNIKTFCALHLGRSAIPGTLHSRAYILRLWPSN